MMVSTVNLAALAAGAVKHMPLAVPLLLDKAIKVAITPEYPLAEVVEQVRREPTTQLILLQMAALV
jgi:hypothetical protein